VAAAGLISSVHKLVTLARRTPIGTAILNHARDLDRYFRSIAAAAGSLLGSTDWFALTQRDVDLYGCLVEDLDPMHNDPKWQEGKKRWDGTIVYGSIGLAMVPRFLAEVGLPVAVRSVAYSIERIPRVRFVRPLRIDQRARAHIELMDVSQEDAAWLTTTGVRIEREGADQPFMHAVVVSGFRRIGTP
jgi:acyl dehydratase